MENLKTKLKQAWDENPVAVLTAAALVLTASAKVVDSVSAAQGRHAYAKQVNNSIKKTKKK